MTSTRHRCLIAVGLLAIFQLSINTFAADVSEAVAKPKKTLPPEVKAVVAEFLEKVKGVKREAWKRKIGDEIDRIIKVSGSIAERAILENAGDAAIEACLPGWINKLMEMYEGFMVNQSPEELAASMQHMRSTEAMDLSTAENYWALSFVQPAEHDIWTTALDRALTKEQAAVWKATEAKQKEVALKEIREFLKTLFDQNREIQRTAIEPRMSEIRTAVELSPERAKTLEELANAAVETSMERWQTRAEKSLLQLDEAQRKAAIKGRHYFIATPEDELPHMMPAWKEGLANFLTDEERQLCESMHAAKTARRTKTFSRLLIALLDQRIAFRPAQRVALESIAERLIEGHPAIDYKRSGHDHFDASIRTFLKTASKASGEEIATILDAVQCKRWKETVAAAEAAVLAHRRQLDLAQAADSPQPIPPEPEELERVISDFFQKKFTNPIHAKSGVLLEFEDVGRVVTIAAPAAARLRTAALGASEQALLAWQGQTEENIRSQISDATGANLLQRLEAMQDFQFARRHEGPSGLAIWEKALKTELTDEQRAIWQKEIEDRAAFQDRTIAAVIVAEFDRMYSLGIQQIEKLEPAVTALVSECREEMRRYQSSLDGTPWYLSPYQSFMPLCGVPEKQMKEILTKEQWDRWTGGEQYANAASGWEDIKSNREQRMKDKKAP